MQLYKFYIAAKLNAVKEHNFVRDQIAEWGHEITFDWTLHLKSESKPDNAERLTQIAADEVQGVVDADFVFLLLPGGRGAHVELGVALGLNKPVFGLAEPSMWDIAAEGEKKGPSSFYFHPRFWQFTDLQGMLWEFNQYAWQYIMKARR